MDNSPHIERDVKRGIAWVGAASSLVGVLDVLAYAIVLALWIPPTQFGVAMLVIPLFPVLDLATDLGLHAAVIQRDDHTEDKISTVFWLNLILSVICVALLAGAVGPLLSWFYGQPILTGLLVAYGSKLVWQNSYFIPSALMERSLRFRELSIIRIIANIAEFGGKIGVAAAGYGIWCFVIGPLLRVFVTAIGVQSCHPWRPRARFEFRQAYDWFRFGALSSAHRILYHAYTNADYLVVGKVFGETANGIYALAYKLVLEPAQVIAEVFNRIAFPAFSRLKHQRERLVAQLISFARFNLVVTLLCLTVVFVAAEDLLLAFWGEEWAVGYVAVRVLCGVGVLRALSFLMPPLLDAMGRPELSLRYTTIAAILLPSLFVIFAKSFGDSLGYLSVALAWIVGYPVAFLMVVGMALSLLQLRARDLMRPLWRIPIWSALAGAAGFGIHELLQPYPALPRLIAESLAATAVFLALIHHFEKMRIVAAFRSIKAPLAPSEIPE